MSVMGRTGRPFRNDLSAQRVQGHIPMILHAGEPKVVLGIGFGTGQTFAAQLLHPIERLDAVDISRTVVDVALEHFEPYQNRLGEDPRVRVIVDDGRAFVKRTKATYDVVTLEMPPHEEAGIVHFYTREFYEKLRERLNADGVVAQWMPVYNVTPAEARSIVQTFIVAFPDAALWHNGANLLLVGFKGGFRVDVARMGRRLERSGVFSDLAVSYLGDASGFLHRKENFLASFLMGPTELAGFSRGATVYTDDRPELEFTWTEFPVSGPERKSLLILENIAAFEPHLGDVDPRLAPRIAPPMSDEIKRIRRSYLDQLRAVAHDNLATYALARGLVDRALSGYAQAIRTQPAFAQAHNNLASLYLRLGRVPEALAASREAARLAPDYADAHYNVGVALARQGRTAEALAAYEDAVRVKPDLARAHDGIGKLRAEMGSPAEATMAFRKAIEVDPTYADAYLNLATVLSSSGELDRAIATVGELLRVARDDPRARTLDERLRQMKQGPRR